MFLKPCTKFYFGFEKWNNFIWTLYFVFPYDFCIWRSPSILWCHNTICPNNRYLPFVLKCLRKGLRFYLAVFQYETWESPLTFYKRKTDHGECSNKLWWRSFFFKKKKNKWIKNQINFVECVCVCVFGYNEGLLILFPWFLKHKVEG